MCPFFSTLSVFIFVISVFLEFVRSTYGMISRADLVGCVHKEITKHLWLVWWIGSLKSKEKSLIKILKDIFQQMWAHYRTSRYIYLLEYTVWMHARCSYLRPDSLVDRVAGRPHTFGSLPGCFSWACNCKYAKKLCDWLYNEGRWQVLGMRHTALQLPWKQTQVAWERAVSRRWWEDMEMRLSE